MKTSKVSANSSHGSYYKKKHGLSNSALEWMDATSTQSSIHGLVWYTRIRSKWFRLILVVSSVIVVLGLPTFVSIKAYDFYTTENVKTDEQWITATSYTYPNITICHPKFFIGHKLKGTSVNVLGI